MPILRGKSRGIMAEYILIKRSNNLVTSSRCKLEAGSENPLYFHEEIIKELFEGTATFVGKVNEIDLRTKT